MSTVLRPWLRLGTADEAAREHAIGHFVLNVLESAPAAVHDGWVPILREREGEVSADADALDQVVELVRTAREAGRTVFLHCGQGIERSPLAAAWILWKLGEHLTFDAAYREIQTRHSITQNRAVWLPWSARNP